MTHIKTTIITTVLLIGIAFPAMAQIGEMRHNFAIGINGGVNLNKVSFQRKIKQSMPMGITGGLTARYISEKYFAMICGAQVELNFSQRGWEEAFELADGTKDLSRSYSRNMNYIDIPFLAHLAFGKDYGVQFFINLGPQVGFLIGESGGLEVRSKKAGSFLLEGRYYFALSDFYHTSKKDDFDRAAHSTISIKLTYLFDLKK